MRAAHPRRQLERVRRRRDRRPRLQQLAQPLHRAGGALHLAPHFGQRGGGAADEARIHQELDELPAGHRAGEHRCAPSHSTKVMPANTSMMPIAVSAARTRVRRIAATKLSSTALR